MLGAAPAYAEVGMNWGGSGLSAEMVTDAIHDAVAARGGGCRGTILNPTVAESSRRTG